MVEGVSAMVGGMATTLISPEDLQRSLASSAGYDRGLATWALEVVSNTAMLVANRFDWTPENVPPAVQSVISLAARRLYTNPDRMTREADGDYSYGLDSSVTNADVFTDTEKATLRGYQPGRNTGGLRVVATTRGDAGLPSGRVPDGTTYGFPWYADGATGDAHLWPGGLR